jgi:hypothetical protein
MVSAGEAAAEVHNSLRARVLERKHPPLKGQGADGQESVGTSSRHRFGRAMRWPLDHRDPWVPP